MLFSENIPYKGVLKVIIIILFPQTILIKRYSLCSFFASSQTVNHILSHLFKSNPLCPRLSSKQCPSSLSLAKDGAAGPPQVKMHPTVSVKPSCQQLPAPAAELVAG